MPTGPPPKGATCLVLIRKGDSKQSTGPDASCASCASSALGADGSNPTQLSLDAIKAFECGDPYGPIKMKIGCHHELGSEFNEAYCLQWGFGKINEAPQPPPLLEETDPCSTEHATISKLRKDLLRVSHKLKELDFTAHVPSKPKVQTYYVGLEQWPVVYLGADPVNLYKDERDDLDIMVGVKERPKESDDDEHVAEDESF